MTDGTLLKPLNLTNLILQNSYIVIMALGMLLVIVAGYIDLSVGSVSGFIGALAAVLMVNYNWNFVAGVAGVPARGRGVIGGAQGWFVAYLKIPSFIVTLAGMLVFKGLALALLQGQSVGPFPEDVPAAQLGLHPRRLQRRVAARQLAGAGRRRRGRAVRAEASRTRRRTCATSMEEEPGAFFLAKNLAFAAAIIWFCWMLASYKGLPNVLDRDVRA